MTDQDDGPSDPNEFESGEAEIEEDLRKRSEFARTLVENGYSGTLVLSRDSLEDLSAPDRLEIIECLRHGPRTRPGLAESAGISVDELDDHLHVLGSMSIVEVGGDDRTVQLSNRRTVIEPLHYPPDEGRELLNAEGDCVVCGTSDAEHYFGIIELPDDETGEHTKTGEEYHGFEVLEWTGDYVQMEYWECDDCYTSGDSTEAGDL